MITEARMAYGGVAAKAVMAPRAQAAMEGQALNQATLEAALKAVGQDVVITASAPGQHQRLLCRGPLLAPVPDVHRPESLHAWPGSSLSCQQLWELWLVLGGTQTRRLAAMLYGCSAPRALIAQYMTEPQSLPLLIALRRRCTPWNGLRMACLCASRHVYQMIHAAGGMSEFRNSLVSSFLFRFFADTAVQVLSPT